MGAPAEVVPIALLRVAAQPVDDHVRPEQTASERIAIRLIADFLSLAVGFEFLAESRPGVRQLSSGRRPSDVAKVTGQAIPVTLHREAEPVLDLERRVIVLGGMSERHFVRLQRTDKMDPPMPV